MTSSRIFVSIIKCFILCVFLFGWIVESQSLNDPCETDVQCTDPNLTCRFVGCGIKRCTCENGKVENRAGDGCLVARMLNDACNSSTDQCLFGNVDCIDGFCKCITGYRASGSLYCVPDIPPNSGLQFRLFAHLSEDCDNNTICFPSYEQSCMPGVNQCTCNSGFRNATLEELMVEPYTPIYCRRNLFALDTYEPGFCDPPPTTPPPENTVGVGEFCGTDEHCIVNATCEWMNCGTKVCVCRDGYTPYNASLCVQAKALTESCGDETIERCDGLGVTCNGSSCVCDDGFVAINNNDECVSDDNKGHLGGFCDTQNPDWQQLLFCAPLLTCNNTVNRCGCTPGTDVVTPKTRRITYVHPILECMYNAPMWLEQFEFDAQCTSNETTTGAGEQCTNCTENSTCSLINCSWQCKCNNGFAPNQDNSACLRVVQAGESCEDGKTVCLGESVACKNSTGSPICECTGNIAPDTVDGVSYCLPSQTPYINIKALGQPCGETDSAGVTHICYTPPSHQSRMACNDTSCVCDGGYRNATLEEKFQYYDEIRFCVSTTPEPTTVCSTGSTETPTTPMTPPTERVNITDMCHEYAVCPQNASCVASGCGYGICECDLGFTPSADNSRCYEWKSLGAECDQDVNTRCFSPNSECNNNTCSCAAGTAPDPYNIYCLASSGSVRIIAVNESCESNTPPPFLVCADTTKMTCTSDTKICTCKEGFRETTAEEKVSLNYIGATTIPYCISSSATTEGNVSCSTTTDMTTTDMTTDSTTMPTTTPQLFQVNNGDNCNMTHICPADSACEPTDCGDFRCRCILGFANSQDSTRCLRLVHVGQQCDNETRCLGRDIHCDGNTCSCTGTGVTPDSFGFYCLLTDLGQGLSFVEPNGTCSNTQFCAFAEGAYETSCTDTRCICASGYIPADESDRYARPDLTVYCVEEDKPHGYRANLSCAAPLQQNEYDDMIKTIKEKIEKERRDEQEHKTMMILIACFSAVGAFTVFAIAVTLIARMFRRRQMKKVEDYDASSTSSRLSLFEGHKNWGKPRHNNPLQS